MPELIPAELREAIDQPHAEAELRPLVRAYLGLLDCEPSDYCEGARTLAERSEVGGELVPDDRGGPDPSSEHVRCRHHLFLEAAQATKRPTIDYRDAWGIKGRVLSNAKGYIKKVKDRAIVLRCLETDEIKVIPYFTRFSDGYYQEAIRKLKRLRSDRGVFLTLTIDPRRFVSLDHAYRELQAAWNKLLTMLQKRYGHRLKFVKVVEFQKNGSPHLHVLFLDIARLIDAGELRKFWDLRYGQGTFVYLKKLGNRINRVISYLVKYMEKNLTMPDIEMQGPDGLIDAASFQQIALSWALNLRAFSTSRGILDNPMSNSNRSWEFLGVADLAIAWSWDGRHYDEVKTDLIYYFGWDG